MIDQVKITARGGHGGAGGVAFIRQKGLKKTPPDGGDGGDGGDVYLIASTDRNTLLDFRFRKFFQANSGEKGSVANRYGAAAVDLLLKVPVGTQVVWTGQIIADLDHDGQKMLIAKGGKGGRGNAHLKSKIDRTPHFAEPGEEGEVKEIQLELKLLADVGIIGLPNAGKSTLLSKLTSARPKIGAYPFTTLEPNLGVMIWKGKTVVLADIPGLIEGAAEGKGLGHDFLRHLERTKLLIHLTSSYVDYRVILNEMFKYSKDLVKRKELVVISQVDHLDPSELKTAVHDLSSHRLKPLLISALTGEGLDTLKDRIISALPD